MAIWDFVLSLTEPSPRPDRENFRVVDVPGSWTRTVTGTSSFQDTIDALPLGTVEVTLRLEPASRVGAYIGDQQVGWLATQRNSVMRMTAGSLLWSDPWLTWMAQLDSAGIQPRFQGLLRIAGDPGRRLINIDVPGRNEPRLSTIAKRIINPTATDG
ncbi:MAG: hypothetical protein ACR2JI_00480 [Mycobacterium sp.]